ncbi:CpaD family pilus assembly lipoprotein [Sphingomonas bacterium]|uniref:CpaD family pilus assembly lipoprotein n=1 Tax=Sphingomonas bacterium TaxID=1895847 RepID=UPI001574FF59|nr:CpaD family pilus assembly lipoprotein [Sphingomonas bacterium]
MRLPFRSTLLLPMLLLGGCTAGDRGLVSPHQPLVGATGATVPGCPDWSDADIPAHEGQSSNYGCATALNLAAMIADPADLLHGKSSTGSNVDVAVRAVRAWREMQPTGKQGIEKVSAKGGG